MINYPTNIVKAMMSWKEEPYILQNVLDESEIDYLISQRKHCEKVTKNSGIINYKYSKAGEVENFVMTKLKSSLGKMVRHGGSFVETPEPFHAHTDTGKIEEMGDLLAPYKNILIPLVSSNSSCHLSTVFFNQRNYGQASHLWRGDFFKDRTPVYNYKMTEYESLTSYTKKPFLESDHKKYLSHLPIESLFGLSIEKIIEWKVGDIIVFDCSHIHASNNFRQKGVKKSLSMFTSRLIE